MIGALAVLVCNMELVMHKERAHPLHGIALYLFQHGLLDFQSASAACEQQHEAMVSYIVKSGRLSSSAVFEYCQQQFDLPVFEFHQLDLTLLQNSNMKIDLIERHGVIPLSIQHHTLTLGITDPTNQQAVSLVAFQTGYSIKPVLISHEQLEQLIQTYLQPNYLYSQVETTLAKLVAIEEPTTRLETQEQDDEPVITFVDTLIKDGIEKFISDIHIEPFAEHTRIRFRHDGLLSEAALIPNELAHRVITRLKIMANLNIAEKRLPQDGRIRFFTKANFNIRINTCPTLFGEKVVLRILDNNQVHLDISALGLFPEQEQLLREKIALPQGLILVTGPTGSGKTITLYSILHHLNQIQRNICSVEDPVEIELPGINQVNIHPRAGLTFANVLHAFLRQDPDVIMVGEIRDHDTAQIAMQAAQTGHLVLSTLHTTHAAQALNRLQALGVAHDLIKNSLILVIAQRLIRKRCVNCKTSCTQCHDGFNGRIGIFEMLDQGKSTDSLRMNGEKQLARGITTRAEVDRVLGKQRAEHGHV